MAAYFADQIASSDDALTAYRLAIYPGIASITAGRKLIAAISAAIGLRDVVISLVAMTIAAAISNSEKTVLRLSFRP